jgi:hypothetical protein
VLDRICGLYIGGGYFLSAHSTYCYCYRMEDWIGHDMAGYGRAGAGMKMHLPSRLPASYGSLAVPVPCTPEIGSSCDCWAWDWASASPQMTCEAELIALLTASILGVCVVVVCAGEKGQERGRER